VANNPRKRLKESVSPNGHVDDYLSFTQCRVAAGNGLGIGLGTTIKLRHKLLTTVLTFAGCLDLSVSFAVHLTTDCSVHVFQQNLHIANIEFVGCVSSTPKQVRSSPYYPTHVFTPRETYQQQTWGPIF
jgi:hypothetical protein